MRKYLESMTIKYLPGILMTRDGGDDTSFKLFSSYYGTYWSPYEVFFLNVGFFGIPGHSFLNLIPLFLGFKDFVENLK